MDVLKQISPTLISSAPKPLPQKIVPSANIMEAVASFGRAGALEKNDIFNPFFDVSAPNGHAFCPRALSAAVEVGQIVLLEESLLNRFKAKRKHKMTGLREKLTGAMKDGMKAGDTLLVSTVRMVIAKMKEQDIDGRTKGKPDGISDTEILSMMQSMIKQRQESAKVYREGGRQELAEKEDAEIKLIEKFLPAQLSDADTDAAVAKLIADAGATSVKDMGKVMAALKEKLAGQVDMTKASALVKQKLAG